MAPKFIKKPTTSHGFTSLLCSGIAVRRMDKGTSNSRRPLRGSKADDEVACDHRRISVVAALPPNFWEIRLRSQANDEIACLISVR